MMKKTFLSAIVLSLGISTISFAQSRTLSILENNTSVRTAAMGNALLGNTNEMYIYNNPAALGYSQKTFSADVSTQIFPKSDAGRLLQHNLGLGYKLKNASSVLAGIRYQGGLNIASAGAENAKSHYKPYEITLDLGYSFSVTSEVAVYATASYTKTVMATKADGLAFSLGTSYYKALNLGSFLPTTLTIGARLLDFGKSIKYNNTGLPYALPTSIVVGGDWAFTLSPFHKLTYALSTRYFTPQDAHETWLSTGLEYTYNKCYSARIGYLHSDKTSNAITFGVGGNYAGIKLNVAYNYAFKNYGIDALYIGLGCAF